MWKCIEHAGNRNDQTYIWYQDNKELLEHQSMESQMGMNLWGASKIIVKEFLLYSLGSRVIGNFNQIIILM